MPGKRKRKRKEQRVQPTNPRDLKHQTLAREMKIAATNMERHRSFWRDTFTRMEMPDIGRKIEMVWSCLEHAFDFQDYSISLLLDALQEAEDQRRKTNGVHVDAIDRSFDAHEARLKAADAFFRRRVETLFVDRTREFDETRSNRNKDEINIRKINVLVNYRIENRLNAAKSTAISKIQQ
ncbi:uncharacterized protein LOC143352178 [Halictus rubicundus]|uniref:uncharacterized protein LOC143352178 n=1 Tax=Halictus rubicundus TaxID=77578 RepID=UPI004035035F